MAQKLLNTQGDFICRLPQTASEQILYKENTENKALKFKAGGNEFKQVLNNKYINSTIKDPKRLQEAEDNYEQIYNAAAFGFCEIDFSNLAKLYREKTGIGIFNELSLILQNVADLTNNNQAIRKYIEGGITVKELVAERVAEARRMLKEQEQERL